MLLYNPWCLRWQSVCLQCGRPGFNPWVGKIPWERKWQPTPVLLPGKSRGRRILEGYSPWGCKESDMTEWLHFHFLQCLYFSFTYFTLYGTLSRTPGLSSSLYEATRSGFHCLSYSLTHHSHPPPLIHPAIAFLLLYQVCWKVRDLYLLFPLPRMLFLKISTWLAWIFFRSLVRCHTVNETHPFHPSSEL